MIILNYRPALLWQSLFNKNNKYNCPSIFHSLEFPVELSYIYSGGDQKEKITEDMVLSCHQAQQVISWVSFLCAQFSRSSGAIHELDHVKTPQSRQKMEKGAHKRGLTFHLLITSLHLTEGPGHCPLPLSHSTAVQQQRQKTQNLSPPKGSRCSSISPAGGSCLAAAWRSQVEGGSI